MVCAKARPWLTSEMEDMQMALEQGVATPRAVDRSVA